MMEEKLDVKELLQYLKQDIPRTSRQIKSKFGLSNPTVLIALKVLVDLNLVTRFRLTKPLSYQKRQIFNKVGERPLGNNNIRYVYFANKITQNFINSAIFKINAGEKEAEELRIKGVLYGGRKDYNKQ